MQQNSIANKENIIHFLTEIIVRSKSAEKEFNLFENDWKEDDLPPFTSLFAYIGSAIVNDFNRLTNDDKLKIFSHIESGINSNDEYLAIAVATGLVEALVTASDDNPELWNKIESHLGTESKKHALAWKNFGQ